MEKIRIITDSASDIGANEYPNLVVLPLSVRFGKEHFAEGFAAANVPAIPQLVEMAQELGVKFIACQMTMDVMGLTKEDFVDGIEVGGAVTFLEYAKDAAPTLTF